ncbi:CoA protein activase [Lutispora sp.]|uniref:CoA protein activase n=1 Tax=Lutispora sp. TaxID=2828727 RepID=UPI002B1FC16A|nr:CoA protein activase [Lutispora sp.]MEA4960410.1 CoA protein activase [Lutispora sp.]
MKVAFPYMGTTVIYKKLLELLGHDVIEPPEPTQRTIDLGVKYSPEFACFPLKVVLGSYIEAVELGAETLVTSGGHGPCRAGFYGETHKKILKNLNYDVDIIIFDDYKRDVWGTIKKVLKIKNGRSWLYLWRAIKTVYSMAKALDDIEKRIERMRAYEVHKGECTKAWGTIKKWFDEVKNVEDVRNAEAESNKLLDGIKLIEVPEADRIRIGIVGEIYVVMEQSINLRIEEMLGNLGAEVERSQYLSQWIDFNLIPGASAKAHELEILKKGEKYIQEIIGGHAKQTVGHIADYAERGFDGVVHLMPFACLPELISQSIIPAISKEHNIPVITLSIDEQTGAANTLTRLEAFMDLIRNFKRTKIA